jgi:hypothetical protein
MSELYLEPAGALPGTWVVAPCGCQFWNEGDGTPEGNAFIFRPHSLQCGYYLQAIRTSQELGHPLTHVMEE